MLVYLIFVSKRCPQKLLIILDSEKRSVLILLMENMVLLIRNTFHCFFNNRQYQVFHNYRTSNSSRTMYRLWTEFTTDYVVNIGPFLKKNNACLADKRACHETCLFNEKYYKKK